MDRYNYLSDVEELKRMMTLFFNKQLNAVFTCETSVEDLENAATASLNIVVRREALKAAQYLEKTYGIPLRKITMLITLNFGIQLIVDLLSAGFVDKIGYRVSIVIAHAASALGLLGLVVLPNLLPDAYTGILLSVMIYAIGGGLIEVLISPIMESCPTDKKER